MKRPAGVISGSPLAAGAGQSGKRITVTASTLPHPAKNLGRHLKPSKSGEIVTNHHRVKK